MSDGRSYDDEEVRAIIDRALKTEPGGKGVSHDDLLAIGAGVGLTAKAIERAALEVAAAKTNDVAVSRVVSRRRRAWLVHALVFAIATGLMFLVNFLTTPGEWWVLFPLFFWGIGLAVHAAFGLSRKVSPRRLAREVARLPPAPKPRVASLAAGEAKGPRVADSLEEALESAETEAPKATSPRRI